MSEEIKSADNAEDIRIHGRRSSDNPSVKADMPHTNGSVLRWLINGITVGGVITAIFLSGRASSSMDTTIKEVDIARTERKELLLQIRDVVIVLKEQNIQQKESDKRFERKFDDANEKLDKINDGVQKNKENIFILQNGSPKVSIQDKTKVIDIAMR